MSTGIEAHTAHCTTQTESSVARRLNLYLEQLTGREPWLTVDLRQRMLLATS
jgi:hypothetical protein